MDLEKVFGDVELFVRYRVKMMEDSIAKLLPFRKGGPEDLCQIHDYSGVPLIFQEANIKGAVNEVTKVFAEHYPEFKGLTIFVNFPAIFLPERTKKKFTILGENAQEGVFEFVRPEYIP